MAASMLQRPVVFGNGSFRRVVSARPARSLMTITNSYKNLENINLSRVADFKMHENDTGSCEVQVARLTARIEQISTHLRANKKDFAAKRGLVAILNQRKSLLQYLYKHNRQAYDSLLKEFGIRSVVVGDTRGASRKQDEIDA